MLSCQLKGLFQTVTIPESLIMFVKNTIIILESNHQRIKYKAFVFAFSNQLLLLNTLLFHKEQHVY